MMTFPTEWKVIKVMLQSTNQNHQFNRGLALSRGTTLDASGTSNQNSFFNFQKSSTIFCGDGSQSTMCQVTPNKDST
jgi:hypothetical protein